MKIIEVSNLKTRNEFLNVSKQLYKNDPNFTCLLDVEIEGIFDPKNNASFKFGEAIRWILKDDNNILIGRIAAFYDNRKKDHSYITSGNIGFFECINDQKAANLLFDTSKKWLESKGMKAMDGNCNFGENLFHWGLLTEGFVPQVLGMPYNFAYYKELFENYGFKDYFQQFSFTKDLTKPWPERQKKFTEFLATRPDYEYKHFNFAEKDKFITDLVNTYNSIWSDFHEEYTPLERHELEKMFDDLKDILIPEFIWFAYTKADNKPIGMAICLPDINQILRKLGNGKLNLMNKLKLLYHLKFANTMNCGRVVASGVIPEYQQKGVIGVLFLKLSNMMIEKKYKNLELSWTGDYNKPVLTIYEQVGAVHTKTHLTYRYIFDKNVEFKRFTNETGYKSRKKPVN